VTPISSPGARTVRVVTSADTRGRRLFDALRTAGPPRLQRLRPGALGRLSTSGLKRLLDRRRTQALILDGPADGGADAGALERLGREGRTFAPAPVLTSSRVLSERLVARAGTLGRLGVIQGLSEVSTQTPDALAYVRTLPLLFRGERPSLDGLRGYVTGLALRAGLKDGFRPRPGVFTNALLAPWSPAEPGTGSPAVFALAPQFLSANLIPPSAGGEQYEGSWFADGAWINAGVRPLGNL